MVPNFYFHAKRVCFGVFVFEPNIVRNKNKFVGNIKHELSETDDKFTAILDRYWLQSLSLTHLQGGTERSKKISKIKSLRNSCYEVI